MRESVKTTHASGLESRVSVLEQFFHCALVLEQLHASLVRVHLLDAVVLRELGHHLRPELLRLAPLRLLAQLLEVELLLVHALQVLDVSRALRVRLALLLLQLGLLLLDDELHAHLLHLLRVAPLLRDALRQLQQ